MSMRWWHLATIATAFSVLAAGSCAEFLRYGPYPAGDPYALLFVVSAILAGGPVVLSLFRFSRRGRRDAWPAAGLCARIAAFGALATVTGYVGVVTMVQLPARWR